MLHNRCGTKRICSGEKNIQTTPIAHTTHRIHHHMRTMSCHAVTMHAMPRHVSRSCIASALHTHNTAQHTTHTTTTNITHHIHSQHATLRRPHTPQHTSRRPHHMYKTPHRIQHITRHANVLRNFFLLKRARAPLPSVRQLYTLCKEL